MNVSDYLNATDIFVLPTLNKGRREGSPVSLLEAMASENVVLASAVPGIKDQLSDFPDHLFEPGNSLMLAGKLQYWLYHPPSKCQQTGKRFRKMILDRFSIEKEVASHQEFYKQVLGIA